MKTGHQMGRLAMPITGLKAEETQRLYVDERQQDSQEKNGAIRTEQAAAPSEIFMRKLYEKSL